MQTWTCAFYAFVSLVAVLPLLFIWSIWHEAQSRGWRWLNPDRRNMYVDGAKTLVAASGIAVALLASSGVAASRAVSSVVAFSAKVAAVSLIACVCLSLITIVALLRCFERAWSRKNEEALRAGRASPEDGELNTRELVSILVPSSAALSSFLVGFLFLGRIAFHF